MKAAMRAREAARLGTIRLLLAAIKQKEVDERIELDDAQVGSIVEKLIKQRKDSIGHFRLPAGRSGGGEQSELVVLQDYLPEQHSAAEVEAEVAAAIAESGAASARIWARSWPAEASPRRPCRHGAGFRTDQGPPRGLSATGARPGLSCCNHDPARFHRHPACPRRHRDVIDRRVPLKESWAELPGLLPLSQRKNTPPSRSARPSSSTTASAAAHTAPRRFPDGYEHMSFPDAVGRWPRTWACRCRNPANPTGPSRRRHCGTRWSRPRSSIKNS